jgi:DNA processing protein
MGRLLRLLLGGFDNIYPRENLKLFNKIIDSGGAIITEYLPYVSPLNILFPRRNRIVSAITKGVLVVEAREKSGALITVNIAKKLSKKVFCIPSNINSKQALGSNMLLNSGAKCVCSINDVLEEFKDKKFILQQDNIIIENKKNIPFEYLDIYNVLSKKPIHINDICRYTNKNISEVNLSLTMLELEGFIKQLPNKEFLKI